MIQPSAFTSAFMPYPPNKSHSLGISPKEIQLLHRVDELLRRRFANYLS